MLFRDCIGESITSFRVVERKKTTHTVTHSSNDGADEYERSDDTISYVFVIKPRKEAIYRLTVRPMENWLGGHFEVSLDHWLSNNPLQVPYSEFIKGRRPVSQLCLQTGINRGGYARIGLYPEEGLTGSRLFLSEYGNYLSMWEFVFGILLADFFEFHESLADAEKPALLDRGGKMKADWDTDGLYTFKDVRAVIADIRARIDEIQQKPAPSVSSHIRCGLNRRCFSRTCRLTSSRPGKKTCATSRSHPTCSPASSDASATIWKA